MIFITGATGSIGSELCGLLAKDNIPARAMCRKQEQLERLQALGLEAVLADFDHAESLLRGMQGCNKLFLLTSPDQKHTLRERLIIDMAIEAGINYVIRLSTAGANLSATLSYSRSHAEIDHYLRSKSKGWTIIRPTGFMQNFIESAHPIAKGILPHMMGNGAVSYIDLRDIALVAKQVLTEDKHIGATYYLSGPESLTVKDVASRLAIALDHEVNDIKIDKEEMRKTLMYAGLSDWEVEALIEQFIKAAGGHEIDVTGEVERLTGQLPRTFGQFALDYKDQFLAH